jgi:hypothetical protein
MESTLSKVLKLQVSGGEPIPISTCALERNLENSYLQRITGMDGRPLVLPVGERVTLWAGPAVVFVGKVQEDQSVLDLLSSEAPTEGEYEDL